MKRTRGCGWGLPILVGILALSSAGCGIFAKTKECKALVDDVNRNGSAIKQVEKSDDPRKMASAARAQAAIASQLASDLSGRTFKVSELKQFASDYATFAKQAASGMNDLAKVIDQFGDLKEQLDEQKSTSKGKKFAGAAQRFGDACKTKPSSACLGIAKVLQRLPKKGDDLDSYARGLESAAADMKRVPREGALSSVVDELVHQTEELATVFHGISDATRKLKTTQTELDTTLAREKPLNASIKSFCKVQ